MTNKQIRQLIASPTQVLVADGVDPESNLGYYGLSSIGKDLLGVTTTSQGQEALSLVPGTHVQAYDSDLDAIASLSTTGAIERTGAGMAATFTVTNSAKQLLDDPSFAAMRTTLELGSISTQSASNVAITGGSISGITDLAITDGGTGASTAQGAINALAGAVNSGQYLRGNGTNVVMSAIQAADVPTLNQNTTGTASNVTGVVALANGGTGATTASNARTNLGATTVGNAVFTAADAAAARTAIGVGAITNRNRIINGGMVIDQRNNGAAQTITAGAALAYSVDRWYAYCTGANVTGQRVQGATAGQFRYQFTGAASVTAIGFGQRIEQLNSADLAGTTATLSVDLANSLLTTVTWTAFYANTADTFGALASPTRTQFATGTFTVNSTVTRYSTQIQIPIEAVTGIEIVFTVGAQTSGTWTIGNVQLEPGNVATPFEARLIGTELLLCQRYLENIQRSTVYMSIASDSRTYSFFAVPKRAIPTITVRGFAGLAGTVEVLPSGGSGSDVTVNIAAANLLFYVVTVNIGAGGMGYFSAYPGSFASSEL